MKLTTLRLTLSLAAMTACGAAFGQDGVAQAIKSYESGNYADAYEQFHNNIIVNPADGLSHLFLGNLYSKDRWYSYAIEEYYDGLKLLPENDKVNRKEASDWLAYFMSRIDGGRQAALDVLKKNKDAWGNKDEFFFAQV